MTSNAITRGAIYVRKDGMHKGQRVTITRIKNRDVFYRNLPLKSSGSEACMYPEDFLNLFEPERSE